MRWPVSHWELVVGGLAVAAAAVAFWVTLHAHFLKYPAWLAVQKADFILGPIGVGLYWRHRRPGNRLVTVEALDDAHRWRTDCARLHDS